MLKIELVKDAVNACDPLRITRRKMRKKGKVISTRIRVKCGCCSEAIEIHADSAPTGDVHQDTLEIGGVFATVDQWRRIFLPILYANETLVEFKANPPAKPAPQMRDVT